MGALQFRAIASLQATAMPPCSLLIEASSITRPPELATLPQHGRA